jgi:hypothetical protein
MDRYFENNTSSVQEKGKQARLVMKVCLSMLLIVTYILLILVQSPLVVQVNTFSVSLPLPDIFNEYKLYKDVALADVSLSDTLLLQAGVEEKEIKERERVAAINRVESFLQVYGSPLVGYGQIIVDKAIECGGDYRLLIGIAGSESGLGKIMYKKYNPYGYLNNVTYSSQREALEILSCKVSQEHLAKCGSDLDCLARRYAGPGDDLEHFISKVRWFASQV